MIEVFLKYKDEKGEEKLSMVDGRKFVVGRHSESDLCIPDGRLSRQHIRIERFADVFVVSDAGSSNGTILNGQSLNDPVALKNGDILELGGLQVLVEFESDEPLPEPEPDVPEGSEPGADGISVASQSQAESSSTATILLLMIPVFGLIFLVLAGGVIYLLVSGSKTTVATKQDDFVYTNDSSDGDNSGSKSTNKKENGTSGSNSTTTSTGDNTSSGPSSGDNSSGTNSVPSGKLTDTGKIEQNGGAFLRRIAQNDPRAFLTTEQAGVLNAKVKQMSGSAAVADNLKSANKNASQLKTLAASKNLKPQFLAIAAVAKLGSNRGDVLQTAQGMTEVLDKLGTQIGNELADDSLLVVAAYDQGSAGDFMKLRNLLQDLANKSPDSTRAIRTIWFLQKNGKITQAEYENALTFLAIGTISQNPKDFGVNAEALAL